MLSRRLTLLRPIMDGIAHEAMRLLAGRTLLVETYVAGTRYHDAAGWGAAQLAALRRGVPLELRREPDNRHDRLAIAVHLPHGKRLGYVPRIDNQAIARLMDAGHRLRAVVGGGSEAGRSWGGPPDIALELYLLSRRA